MKSEEEKIPQRLKNVKDLSSLKMHFWRSSVINDSCSRFHRLQQVYVHFEECKWFAWVFQRFSKTFHKKKFLKHFHSIILWKLWIYENYDRKWMQSPAENFYYSKRQRRNSSHKGTWSISPIILVPLSLDDRK